MFHPDGKHLVAAGRGREVYLWEIATGKRVRTYKPGRIVAGRLFGVSPKTVTYWSVAVSPDGRTIAAGGSDESVTLWPAEVGGTRAEVPAAGTFAAFDPQVRALHNDRELDVWVTAFTSDTVLWTNDGANGLQRWNLTDPRKPVKRRFVPPAGASASELQSLAVSPDRRRLYTGDRSGRVREWDADAGTELRAWQTRGWVSDVAVSADGTRLAATGTDATVWVFDLTGARGPLEIPLFGTYGNGVAFAPKRPFVVASDGDGNVRFWHRDTGQQVGIPLRFHGEVTRVRFRPHSDEFAVPAGDTVCLCGVPDPPGDVLTAGHGSRVRGLDFSPDGNRLAVAGENTFDLFDLPTRGRVPLALAPGGTLVARFDADPARPRVFRGTRNGFDWFTVPGGIKLEPGASFGLDRVNGLETRRDAVVVMGESVVATYDPATLKLKATRRLGAALPVGMNLSAIAVRPDGGEVLVAYGDGVTVLAGDTLAPLREWPVGDEVLAARYTPDGTKVLLGLRANVAELRDARTGARVGAAMPHARAVADVGVSPDGAVLLTGSRDGTARFWDAATGLPLGSPLRHAGPVTHVAFAPGGEHAATGTADGSVTIWDIPPPPAEGTVDELRAKFGQKE